MRVTAAVDLGYQQGISSHSQPDTPRRKLLFVPGDSASKLFFLACLVAFSCLFFCPFPYHVQPDATARTETSIKQVRKQATNQNKHER
jgi:hypothetical protein